MSRIDAQTLALAGMFQAAVQVEALASQGACEQNAFSCSFASLFRFDASSAIDVFGDSAGLAVGCKALMDYLGGREAAAGGNIAYYVMAMSRLAATLLKNHALADAVQTELRRIGDNARDFELGEQSVVAQIDRLYQDRISRLRPQIMVRGEQRFLTDSDNAARIRTLLFAGIRAAVLWLQLGGGRWRLLLNRRKYVAVAQGMLADLPPSQSGTG